EEEEEEAEAAEAEVGARLEPGGPRGERKRLQRPAAAMGDLRLYAGKRNARSEAKESEVIRPRATSSPRPRSRSVTRSLVWRARSSVKSAPRAVRASSTERAGQESSEESTGAERASHESSSARGKKAIGAARSGALPLPNSRPQAISPESASWSSQSGRYVFIRGAR